MLQHHCESDPSQGKAVGLILIVFSTILGFDSEFFLCDVTSAEDIRKAFLAIHER